MVDADIWTATPTIKIIQPAMMVYDRPKKSAQSPAMTAPKKVPAERIEVIRDWSLELMTKSASGVAGGYGSLVNW